jgi:hypothetical protein
VMTNSDDYSARAASTGEPAKKTLSIPARPW